MLAAIVGICLVPATLMIRDKPPHSSELSEEAGAEENSVTVGQIVREPAFWGLSAVAAIIITSIMVLTFNMVPLAESLGIDRARGALLASIMAFSGMAGSVLFGWVADKIGGARGLALLAFDSAVLLGLLLLDLPYAGLAVVIGLLGLHGAGMIPNLSRALAHSLGREGFSRAFGLSTALSVPFTVVGIMAMGTAFTRTGSYAPALTGVAVCLLVAVPIALWTQRRTVSLA
jgi:MFS family permease